MHFTHPILIQFSYERKTFDTYMNNSLKPMLIFQVESDCENIACFPNLNMICANSFIKTLTLRKLSDELESCICNDSQHEH